MGLLSEAPMAPTRISADLEDLLLFGFGRLVELLNGLVGQRLDFIVVVMLLVFGNLLVLQ